RLKAFPPGSRALPYLNTARLVAGAREMSTTAITYLGFAEQLSPVDQRNFAYQYARAVSLPNAPAEATGFIPRLDLAVGRDRPQPAVGRARDGPVRRGRARRLSAVGARAVDHAHRRD